MRRTVVREATPRPCGPNITLARPISRWSALRFSFPTTDCSAPGHLPGLSGALRRLLVRSRPLANHSISTCEQVITEWGGLAYPPTDPTLRPGLRTPLSTVFQVESSLGLHPSEVSLRSCRWALSGRAVLRACSSDLAVGLLRGFELSVPHRADLTATRLRVSNGSVLTRACCSHVRAVAPLLVVSPLRGLPWPLPLSLGDLAGPPCGGTVSGLAPCLHVSSSLGLFSRRRASPVHHPETVFLVGPAPRALFRVSEIRSADPKSSGPPPWGFVRLQPCTACAARPSSLRTRICRTVGPRDRKSVV